MNRTKKQVARKNIQIISFFVLAFCLTKLCAANNFQEEQSQKKISLKEVLAQIPSANLSILEEFFRSLFVHHHLGYVLHGDKPMMMVSYDNPLFTQPFNLSLFEPDNLCMRKGIECWRKYYTLFPSKNYLFVFLGDPSKDQFIELICINKPKFIETVENHSAIFKPIFGSDVTGEKLLTKLAKDRTFWDYNLNYEMIGLLLGYGKANSHSFQRRADINPKFYGKRFTLKKLSESPSPAYNSIEDEILALKKCFRPLQDDHPLDEGFMAMPGFFALDCPETQTLKQSLEQQRKKMIRVYRDGSFFTKTMHKYMGIEN